MIRMIRNTHCPYCGNELIVSENLPRSRSVEHLIPNAVLSAPRSRGDGDFYACRECNSIKSKLDDILSVIARAQAANPRLAAKALIKAVTSDRGSSKRFVDMLRGADRHRDGIHMTMPFDGRELFDYVTFLAKGIHFLQGGRIVDESQVIQQEFVGKSVLEPFHAMYHQHHGTNPILDLAQNPRTRTWGDGECVLWSQGDDHFLVLHWYIGIMIHVRPYSRRNYRRARELERQMLRDFARHRVSNTRRSDR